ncbi:hypothetical protein CK203_053156 [Vitis vinifera]|uniref:DUF4283 domain-containing protein n=1 Tax=Vitis vinifera TaxID=29760 RepID=A0A438GP04_VITVI|nr:hypothetical protein CK203_053156 [Vitis vinifera]
MTKGRSFADAVKGGWNKESKIIRVEVAREELSRNLSRLEHCLIGSWSPNNTTGENLEPWVGKWPKLGGSERCSNGLGALGPKLRLFGGRETRKEVWVRILGLPISLWVPSVLRGWEMRVEGFSTSILRRRAGGVAVGQGLEDAVDKDGRGRKQSLWSPTTREVEGDEASLVAKRVEQLVGVGTEVQSQSDDGTDRLSQDMGPTVKRAQMRVGSPQGSGLKSGPLASGLLWAYGPSYLQLVKPKGGSVWAVAI